MRWDDERYVAIFTGESCGPLWRTCQPRLVETQQFLAALNAFWFFGKTAAITAGASQDCSASSSLMLHLSFGSGKR